MFPSRPKPLTEDQRTLLVAVARGVQLYLIPLTRIWIQVEYYPDGSSDRVKVNGHDTSRLEELHLITPKSVNQLQTMRRYFATPAGILLAREIVGRPV